MNRSSIYFISLIVLCLSACTNRPPLRPYKERPHTPGKASADARMDLYVNNMSTYLVDAESVTFFVRYEGEDDTSWVAVPHLQTASGRCTLQLMPFEMEGALEMKLIVERKKLDDRVIVFKWPG